MRWEVKGPAKTAPQALVITLIGPSGLHDIGSTFTLAGQFDGILFFDTEHAILLWNTDAPATKVTRVARSAAELSIAIITPRAEKKPDTDRLPFFLVLDDKQFWILQDDNTLGLIEMTGTMKKGKIEGYVGQPMH